MDPNADDPKPGMVLSDVGDRTIRLIAFKNYVDDPIFTFDDEIVFKFFNRFGKFVKMINKFCKYVNTLHMYDIPDIENQTLIEIRPLLSKLNTLVILLLFP